MYKLESMSKDVYMYFVSTHPKIVVSVCQALILMNYIQIQRIQQLEKEVALAVQERDSATETMVYRLLANMI
jgi:hypothetical protein